MLTRSHSSRTRPAQQPRPQEGAVSRPAVAAKPHNPDGLLIFALLALVSVGTVMVYSATAMDGGFESLKKTAIWLGLGLPALLVGIYTPLAWWRRLAPWALGACFVALVSLLVPGNPLAVNLNGATRWLGTKAMTVQPSEFAKLAFILFAAAFLERRGPKMRLTRGGDYWFGFLLILGALAAVIYKEPDLGTALVIGGTAYCMLIAAGADMKALVIGAVIAAMVVGTAAWNTKHQRARLLSYADPWAYRSTEGHQVIQSWKAMARGGLWGVGLGQSLQKLDDRLPEAETDFIFAVIAEELGLVRALGVILLYVILAWRGYYIAARAPDRYSGLIALGVTSWIAVQAGINLGVVTGTIPNTGVPLPFLSKGGSSLLALLMAAGLLVGISRYTVRPTRGARPQ